MLELVWRLALIIESMVWERLRLGRLKLWLEF
jgi:hypothetical protein